MTVMKSDHNMFTVILRILSNVINSIPTQRWRFWWFAHNLVHKFSIVDNFKSKFLISSRCLQPTGDFDDLTQILHTVTKDFTCGLKLIYQYIQLNSENLDKESQFLRRILHKHANKKMYAYKSNKVHKILKKACYLRNNQTACILK